MELRGIDVGFILEMKKNNTNLMHPVTDCGLQRLKKKGAARHLVFSAG